MNQQEIGMFITQKRRSLNLTQEQLAEKLNISNKTISKWERGKSIPDYSIIELLCETLHITVSELMDGETKEENSIRLYDDQQIIDMLSRIQQLENQKQIIGGIALIIMGIALQILSQSIDGTGFKDFISGFLISLSIGGMLIGIFIVVHTFAKSVKNK